MVNLIGTIPNLSELLAISGAHVHVYGKSPRPGRKVGHVTVTAGSADEAAHLASRVQGLISS
jgi:5-(carboxyamino)imidazole ribonucleotide synthase